MTRSSQICGEGAGLPRLVRKNRIEAALDLTKVRRLAGVERGDGKGLIGLLTMSDMVGARRARRR